MDLRLAKIETFKKTPEILECMNAEQVAEFLGVSVPFVRRNLDKIPHKRIGARVLFGRRAVLDWLNGQNDKKESDDE